MRTLDDPAVATRAAPLVDTVCVLVFVVIGRAAHSHGLDPAGVASTAWPFVSGLAVGWLLVARRHCDGASLRAGLVVWLSTVALGMTLRVVADQGIAVAFVAVALAFLGLFLLGWRLVALEVSARVWGRARRRQTP
jgi:hypothetical protein